MKKLTGYQWTESEVSPTDMPLASNTQNDLLTLDSIGLYYLVMNKFAALLHLPKKRRARRSLLALLTVEKTYRVRGTS